MEIPSVPQQRRYMSWGAKQPPQEILQGYKLTQCPVGKFSDRIEGLMLPLILLKGLQIHIYKIWATSTWRITRGSLLPARWRKVAIWPIGLCGSEYRIHLYFWGGRGIPTADCTGSWSESDQWQNHGILTDPKFLCILGMDCFRKGYFKDPKGHFSDFANNHIEPFNIRKYRRYGTVALCCIVKKFLHTHIYNYILLHKYWTRYYEPCSEGWTALLFVFWAPGWKLTVWQGTLSVSTLRTPMWGHPVLSYIVICLRKGCAIPSWVQLQQPLWICYWQLDYSVVLRNMSFPATHFGLPDCKMSTYVL